jgi:hypothetical protein
VPCPADARHIERTAMKFASCKAERPATRSMPLPTWHAMQQRAPTSPGASLRPRGTATAPAPSEAAGRRETGTKRAFLGQNRAVCLPFAPLCNELNGCPQFAFSPSSQTPHLSPYFCLGSGRKHQLPGGNERAQISRFMHSMVYVFALRSGTRFQRENATNGMRGRSGGIIRRADTTAGNGKVAKPMRCGRRKEKARVIPWPLCP